MRLLADDRDHRLVVELGVVEPVEQVDRARPGRRHAHADLVGELGVRARHERRHLLMAGLDVAKVPCPPPVGVAECTVEATDAVTRIPVEPVQVPLDQSVDHEIAHRVHRHAPLLARCG